MENKITNKEIEKIKDMDEGYDLGYEQGRQKALADFEKLIEIVDEENGWEENPVTKHRAILVLTLKERLKKSFRSENGI